VDDGIERGILEQLTRTGVELRIALTQWAKLLLMKNAKMIYPED
jgi:hypothetical protein